MRSVSKEKLFNKRQGKTRKPLNQRSIILFHSAIKSEKTRKLYDYHLTKFKKHFIIKNEDSLISIGEKKIQRMIEDYLLYMRDQEYSYSECNNQLNALRKFFSMNDIICNWDKLRMMLPEKIKSRGDKPYSTEELRILLRKVSNKPLWTAVIHFMSASGCRAGFVEELKIKHLTDMENNCKAVKVYADHVTEYTTFIHAEAVQALQDYFEHRKAKGEKLTDESWVFCGLKDHTKFLDANTVTRYLCNYLKDLPIERGERINHKYQISSTHGIRKRWNTIVKSNPEVNPNHAEKMFAHSTSIPLDSRYHKPTVDILFDEYKKVIPELMISEEWKLKNQIKEKDNEIDELKKKEIEIQRLNKDMLSIQNTMIELEKRLSKS